MSLRYFWRSRNFHVYSLQDPYCSWAGLSVINVHLMTLGAVGLWRIIMRYDSRGLVNAEITSDLSAQSEMPPSVH